MAVRVSSILEISGFTPNAAAQDLVLERGLERARNAATHLGLPPRCTGLVFQWGAALGHDNPAMNPSVIRTMWRDPPAISLAAGASAAEISGRVRWDDFLRDGRARDCWRAVSLGIAREMGASRVLYVPDTRWPAIEPGMSKFLSGASFAEILHSVIARMGEVGSFTGGPEVSSKFNGDLYFPAVDVC